MLGSIALACSFALSFAPSRALALQDAQKPS